MSRREVSPRKYAATQEFPRNVIGVGAKRFRHEAQCRNDLRRGESRGNGFSRQLHRIISGVSLEDEGATINVGGKVRLL